MLAVALDALGLIATRNQLLQDWKSFKDAGLHKAHLSLGNDSMISQPLAYLHNIHHGLRAILSTPEVLLKNTYLNRLCEILRDTPMILRKRSVNPSGEMDGSRSYARLLESVLS